MWFGDTDCCVWYLLPFKTVLVRVLVCKHRGCFVCLVGGLGRFCLGLVTLFGWGFDCYGVFPVIGVLGALSLA